MKSLSRTLIGHEGMGSRDKRMLCAGYRRVQITRYQSCQAAMQKPKEINEAFNESSTGSFLLIFGVGTSHSEVLQLESCTGAYYWKAIVHGAFCYLRDALSSSVQPGTLHHVQLCPHTHTPALPSAWLALCQEGNPQEGSGFCTAPAMPLMNTAHAELSKGITGTYSAAKSH